MPRKKTPAHIRKRPKQERSQQTVTVILDAAVQVFSKRGYGEATTTRIADRAGVSVGSLYQYFPNKDALLVALTERHIERSHTAVRVTLDDLEKTSVGLQELMERLVRAMVRLHVTEPVLHRVLFEQIPKKPAIEMLKQKSERELIERFEALLSAHSEVAISDIGFAVRLVAQTVESLSHWYVLDVRKGLDEASFVRAVTAMVCVVLRGETEVATKPA